MPVSDRHHSGWGDSGDFGCICGSKRFKGSQVILGMARTTFHQVIFSFK